VGMPAIGKMHVQSSLPSVAKSQSRAQLAGGNAERVKQDWKCFIFDA
jgi:hypothetical protein